MGKYRIGLGVTGGIAAYKAVEVMRLLQKSGCEVSVAMTRHATEFVQPLTFRALTDKHVIVDDYDPQNPDPIAHINFSQNIDLLLIVPATANIIAKFANGVADDFLIIDVSRFDGSGPDRSGNEHDDVGTARNSTEYRAAKDETACVLSSRLRVSWRVRPSGRESWRMWRISLRRRWILTAETQRPEKIEGREMRATATSGPRDLGDGWRDTSHHSWWDSGGDRSGEVYFESFVGKDGICGCRGGGGARCRGDRSRGQTTR